MVQLLNLRAPTAWLALLIWGGRRLWISRQFRRGGHGDPDPFYLRSGRHRTHSKAATGHVPNHPTTIRTLRPPTHRVRFCYDETVRDRGRSGCGLVVAAVMATSPSTRAGGPDMSGDDVCGSPERFVVKSNYIGCTRGGTIPLTGGGSTYGFDERGP